MGRPFLMSRLSISARDLQVLMFVATGSPIQQSVTAWIHAADSHSEDRSSSPSPPPCGQSDRLLGCLLRHPDVAVLPTDLEISVV